MNEQQNNTQFVNQPNVMTQPNWNRPTSPMGMMMPWWYYPNAGNNNQGPTNPWFMNAQPQTPTTAFPQGGQVTPDVPMDSQSVETPNLTNSRPVVSCGIISSQDEIKPADIPMDGGFGMFMEKDFSAIYIKQWQSDGKIYTKRFVEDEEEPEEVVVSPAPSEEMMSKIDGRFEKLEGYLNSLAQRMDNYISENVSPQVPQTPTPKKSTTKKDGGSSK